ncbi:hypothetical protein PR048_004131, partial [Dryococelus australis]
MNQKEDSVITIGNVTSRAMCDLKPKEKVIFYSSVRKYFELTCDYTIHKFTFSDDLASFSNLKFFVDKFLFIISVEGLVLDSTVIIRCQISTYLDEAVKKGFSGVWWEKSKVHVDISSMHIYQGLCLQFDFPTAMLNQRGYLAKLERQGLGNRGTCMNKTLTLHFEADSATRESLKKYRKLVFLGNTKAVVTLDCRPSSTCLGLLVTSHSLGSLLKETQPQQGAPFIRDSWVFQQHLVHHTNRLKTISPGYLPLSNNFHHAVPTLLNGQTQQFSPQEKILYKWRLLLHSHASYLGGGGVLQDPQTVGVVSLYSAGLSSVLQRSYESKLGALVYSHYLRRWGQHGGAGRGELKWKEKFIQHVLSKMCDKLDPDVTTVVKDRTEGYFFKLQDIRSTVLLSTESERYQTYSGVNPDTGKVEMGYWGLGSDVPSRIPRSACIRNVLK